jgi:type II secretory pathway component PulK
VALATILATKLSFDGWLERRRTLGVLAAEQAVHFGLGAEALAADVLGQAQNTQVTLNQPWAQPTQPLPLTPPDDPEGEPIGSLQGALEDMQGRFNLNNLAHVATTPAGTTPQIGAAGTQFDPVPLEQFKRLLTYVGLEDKWACIARDWITPTDIPCSPDGAKDSIYTSQTPPYRTGMYPMMSASELMNLPGFGADRYRKIAPYVTALPGFTKINVCTAPAWTAREQRVIDRGGFALPPDLAGAVPAGPCGLAGLRTLPPRENGGNFDVKQLTKGAKLYLPVLVEGGLFSPTLSIHFDCKWGRPDSKKHTCDLCRRNIHIFPAHYPGQPWHYGIHLVQSFESGQRHRRGRW